MKRRESPWKFLICTAIALAFVSLLPFVVSENLWRALWPPLVAPQEIAEPVGYIVHLLPPPSVEVEAEPLPEEEEPPPRQQPETPEWWHDAWQEHLSGGIVVIGAGDAPMDSSLADLRQLGLDMPLQLQPLLAVADSNLASRLAVLETLTPHNWELLKPYLQALATAKIHSEIASEAAALFDESIMAEIQVTDRPEDRRRDGQVDK